MGLWEAPNFEVRVTPRIRSLSQHQLEISLSESQTRIPALGKMLIFLYSSVESRIRGSSSVFRDFIYMDINRVQSIIAQLQQGLLNEVLEGKTNQTAGKMQMAANLLAMLLPVSISGSVEHSRASSLSESRGASRLRI